MPMHDQQERADIDLGWDDRPVPADVEPIVRRQDRLIEDFERRFEKRRACTPQDQRDLLGDCRGNQPRDRPARQGSLITASANAGGGPVPVSHAGRVKKATPG